MTTGKTITFTRQTFIGKVMSLLFNMLSRLVIAYLPRSKSLLISWLQSSSAVILEPQKIKSVTVSIDSPSTCHEVGFPRQEYCSGLPFRSPYRQHPRCWAAGLERESREQQQPMGKGCPVTILSLQNPQHDLRAFTATPPHSQFHCLS